METERAQNIHKESKNKLFTLENRVASNLHVITNRYYEISTTIVEFIAALLFLIGSILFFHEDLKNLGTWLFLWGSIFFIIRPGLKLARELHLMRLPKKQQQERDK